MNLTKRLLLSALLLPLLLSATDILPLSEIRPGMKGIGKTIFKGSEIEQFDFEVLGIQENALGPGKSIIWTELHNPILTETGVMQGMSGSPLYIDGRIIGAVAYGMSYAKKPIAGVTPIQDILKTSEYNTPTISVEISNINFNLDEQSTRTLRDTLMAAIGKRLDDLAVRSISPIELIRTNDRSLVQQPSFKRLLGTAQIRPNFQPNTVAPGMFQLREADAVAIPLIRGDLEYTASGTVTYVNGKDVYMFGHPFYNLGTVNFPLHKAEVITPFPSYNTSFKIHATRHMVGTVKQDRLSAVHGVLGEEPVLMPMKIFLKNRNKTINLEIVNHPLLNPTLTGLSLLNTFSSEYQDFGFQSLRVNGRIFIEGEKNIEISDFYSGLDSYNQFSNLMIAIQFFLLNNREKPANIQKIDFEFEGFEALRRSSVEEVMVNKHHFKPGEPITLTITLQHERGPRATEQITIEAPKLTDNSEFFIFVGGKDEMLNFDSKNVKTDFFPTSLRAIIRAIGNLRKNNRIFVKIVSAQKGLFVNGYEYAQVPGSIQSVFSHNPSEFTQQNVIKMSTLAEYQIDVPNVITGWKVFKLAIQER
jgi:hypothetical protein